jgi:trans-aconitate methyltransferase
METAAIKAGYNRVWREYAKNRDKLKSDKYVNRLVRVLAAKALVLDLGCGDGVPVDELLIKKGNLVIGMDIAEEMVRQARKNCPEGEFITGDILKLKPGQFKADAVVSFYTMFHLPRVKHGEMLKLMGSFMKKGGWLLITMGDKDFEGWHDFYGTRMWSSQYGPEKNRDLIEKAGFKIDVDELDGSGGERHQVIMAKKV